MAHWVVLTQPTAKSAGVRAQHRLCHLLRACGEDAYVSSPEVSTGWDTPHGAVTTGSIAVYCQGTHGNPWGSDHVVRWCTHDPGLLGGDDRFPRSELVVYYEPRLRGPASRAAGYELPTSHCVRVATIDPVLFRRPSRRGALRLCYVGKGCVTDAPVPEGVTAITAEWPATHEDTAALLRFARDLYLYDRSCSLALEAYACGVRVWEPCRGKWRRAVDPCVDIEAAWNDLAPVQRLIRLAKEKWDLAEGAKRFKRGAA